ncbi:hypothetical protein BGZ81_003229 [Podila clonocystis]|nr:hypothetical protein BGZ81_003229 [Podila clonocystis]
MALNTSVGKLPVISDESKRTLSLPIYGGRLWLNKMKLASMNCEGLGPLLHEALADPATKPSSESSPTVLKRLRRLGLGLRSMDQVGNIHSADTADHICRIANKSIHKHQPMIANGSWNVREPEYDNSVVPQFRMWLQFHKVLTVTPNGQEQITFEEQSMVVCGILLIQFLACRMGILVFVFGNKVQPTHYGPTTSPCTIGLFVDDSYKSNARTFHVLEIVMHRKPILPRMDIDKKPQVSLATFRAGARPRNVRTEYRPPEDKALLAFNIASLEILEKLIMKAVKNDPHDHERGLGTYQLMTFLDMSKPDQLPRGIWTTAIKISKEEYGAHPHIEISDLQRVVAAACDVLQQWKVTVEQNFDRLWDDAVNAVASHATKDTTDGVTSNQAINKTGKKCRQ